MAAGDDATIVVPIIAPATTGDISNSATIESTTLDYASDNDNADVDTTIASAVLMQIDVAVDGVDGVDGLERPFRLAISPDGKHIYVPAIVADAVVVLARNVDGTLSFVEAQRNGLDTPDQPDFPKAVAVSADGNNVYVTTEWDSKLIVYSRNSATGALTYVETHQNGVDGVSGIGLGIAVTVSADGENVYVAGPNDNAVAVFNRDTSTGALTFSTAIVDGVGGVDGLAGAFDVALSPDDAYLYVAGMLDDAIAVFSRATGGALTYVDQLDDAGSPMSLAISSDGKHLYAVAGGLAAFARDAGSGALTHIATYGDGQDGIVGLEGMYGVAIAPDGGYAYVAAQYDGALGAFARDAVTGALRFIEVQKDGVGGIDGLGVAWALAVSPDSAFVYVSSGVEPDSAVSAFSVDLAAAR
jgi:6-phosphogluconolactonase (cycloisomerase 2 family)